MKLSLMLVIMLMSVQVASAEIAVIAHPDLTLQKLDKPQVKRLFLGKTKVLSGVRRIELVDQPENSGIRDYFYKQVAKKNAAQLQAYWAKRIFSGKGVPPAVLNDSAAVLAWVKKTKGGVGYIDAGVVDPGVKILYRFK